MLIFNGGRHFAMIGFPVDIVEAIGAEPGLEEFELKVALLSRPLTC